MAGHRRRLPSGTDGRKNLEWDQGSVSLRVRPTSSAVVVLAPTVSTTTVDAGLASQTFACYLPPMSPITPPGETWDRIFLFMQQRLLAGDPPTIREVQEAFGFRSVQTAREHLDKLVQEG